MNKELLEILKDLNNSMEIQNRASNHNITLCVGCQPYEITCGNCPIGYRDGLYLVPFKQVIEVINKS